MELSDRMRLGDRVILDINNERQAFVHLRSEGEVKVGKGYCSTDPLIGAHYGNLFELSADEQCLEKRKRVCETAGEDWGNAVEVDRNNSQLQDAGTANQALTAKDIEKLRKDGKTGDEIIASLTANSATYQNKTHFSQEKYRRKKAKKYLVRATPIRPTACSIAEVYFSKLPFKIGSLRADSLAILLSLANIGARSRALVVDAVGGLVTGAVVERMSGLGSVVAAHLGDRAPPSDILHLFNFPDAVRKGVITAPLASLQALLKEGRQPAADAAVSMPAAMDVDAVSTVAVAVPGALPNGNTAESENAATEPDAPSAISPVLPSSAVSGVLEQERQGNEAALSQPSDQKTASVAGRSMPPAAAMAIQLSVAADQGTVANGRASRTADEEAAQARAAVAEERRAQLRELCAQGFQTCILAAPNVLPRELLATVMPMLAPSASFAIFFNSLQPLAECMHELQVSKGAVAVQLQESWWREHQVLPGRTHPQMSTSGSGGYILSGIKVSLS